MNTKPASSSRPTTRTPTQPPAQTPTQKAMKQFSQTDAESGRGTPEIEKEKVPPPKEGGRDGRRAKPPSQLDPGSSPYEEPNSEQRDR